MIWRKRNPKTVVSEKLAEAKAALDDAKLEKEDAERQTGLRDRLHERWMLVHERNNIAELFTEAYGSRGKK